MTYQLEQAIGLALQKELIKSTQEIDQVKSKAGIDVVTLFSNDGRKVARYSIKELNAISSSAELERVVSGVGPSALDLLQSDGSPKKKFEYKFIRVDLKGRGITLEISLLDIDGVRVSRWADEKGFTLPSLLRALGSQGWEMVNHTVNQDNKSNTVTLHYFSFKREV